MMTSRQFVRDNGDIVETDISYRIHGWSELEITDCDAWLWTDRNDVDAPTFKLNDNEMERLSIELHEDEETWDMSYDD